MSGNIKEILDFAIHSLKIIDDAPLTEDKKKSSLILIAQEVLDMCKCELLSYKAPQD